MITYRCKVPSKLKNIKSWGSKRWDKTQLLWYPWKFIAVKSTKFIVVLVDFVQLVTKHFWKLILYFMLLGLENVRE